MDLSQITGFAFHEKFSEVGQQLQDDQQFEAVLDEARREIPLVEILLGLAAKLKTVPDEEERREAFSRVMHDVHLIITLWKLTMPKDRIAQPTEVKDNKPQPGSLRFRRFGTN